MHLAKISDSIIKIDNDNTCTTKKDIKLESPAYIVLRNVSESLMPMASDTGATSSLAATRGNRFCPIKRHVQS